ncbi:MAG: hypothetical protein AAF236_13900 [Verrucomicrobiota bacterium]
MRKRDRNINIFSMSALDLFASAMGAFAVITLVLIPFYQKTSTVEVVAEDPPPEEPPPTPQAPPTLPVGFLEAELAVVIEWEAPGIDIDLHIFHSQEHLFFNNVSTDWMRLTGDETDPSRRVKEIAVQEELEPFVNEGAYEVRVAYYRDNDDPGTFDPIEVSGLVTIFPTGGGTAASETFNLMITSRDRFNNNQGVLGARFSVTRSGDTFALTTDFLAE